jgi:hypothetical protein
MTLVAMNARTRLEHQALEADRLYDEKDGALILGLH